MLLRPSSINQITFSPLGGLYAYLLALPNQVIFIPLLDPVGTTNPRVYNPALAKGRNIVVNGTFATDTIWSKGTGWTISAGAAHGLATSAAISQTIPVITGLIHETIYAVLNYASGECRIILANNVGTNRNSDGSYTQNLSLVSGSTVQIDGDNALVFTGDIDDVSIKALNIPANSMTATATGALARGEYWSFDGTGDVINIYSNSLNSAIDPNEITINIFVKSDLLVEASSKYIYRIENNGNNAIRLIKNSVSNQLTLTYSASGVVKTTNIVLPDTSWHMITMTISFNSDELITYLDGVLVNTIASLGEFTGNISGTLFVLGASSTAGASSWLGDMRLFQIFNTALPAATIANIYALSGL